MLSASEEPYGNTIKNKAAILPWRRTRNPYRILVSEVMLQQTQVERVFGKYPEFIKIFPDFHSLSRASLRKLLRVWQGMGYNRRAIALTEIAKRVVKDFNRVLPDSVGLLATLPGIGMTTASAVCAFAFNQPTVFIETNIRRVFIHFFFRDRDEVRDSEILPLVEKTMDKRNPREWYCALMDYGVMLKKQYPNPNKRSAHYQKQTPFAGSNRQIRGKILKAIIDRPKTLVEIQHVIKKESRQIRGVLTQLQKEGFLIKKGEGYFIA